MPPVVGAIAIGVAKFGAAIGIGAGVVTATTTSIAVSILTSAVSFGISKVAQLLAPRPKLPRPTTPVTIRQAAAPRQVILGSRRVAGIVSDMHLTGANKEFFNLIITLAGHEVNAIGNLYFDDVLVPLDGSGNATGNFAGHVHVEKNLGGPNQARLAGLATEDGTHWGVNFRQAGCGMVWVRLKHNPDKFTTGVPNITFDVDGMKSYNWTSGTFGFSHNAALNAAAWLTDLRSGAKFANRVKISSAMLSHSGLTLFDAAKVADGDPKVAAWGVDSATAGAVLKCDFGAGKAKEPIWAQVYPLAGGSAAQWKVQWSDDDAVWNDAQEEILQPEWGAVWNLVRLKPNGAHRWWRLRLENTPGAGPEFGEWQLWEAATNKAQLQSTQAVCDEDVNLNPSGTEKRYTLDGVFTSDARKADLLGQMMVAMGGTAVYVGGEWKLYAGKYTAPTVTIGEDDLAGPVHFTGLKATPETYNVVRGTFSNAAQKWQETDFPEVRNEAYIAEDDGAILPLANLALGFTVSGARCQRLAKIVLEASRRRELTLACKLAAWQVEVGQTIAVNFAKYGWVGKTFQVMPLGGLVVREGRGEEGPHLGVELVLKEVDAAVYAWNEATEERAVPAPGTPTLPLAPPSPFIPPNDDPTVRPRLRGDVELDGHAGNFGGILQHVDSGGVVLAAGADFARGYTNKHLGNVPDDVGTDRRAATLNQKTGGDRAIIAVKSDFDIADNRVITASLLAGAVTALKRVDGVVAQDVPDNRLWNAAFVGTAGQRALGSGSGDGSPTAPTGYEGWTTHLGVNENDGYTGNGEYNLHNHATVPHSIQQDNEWSMVGNPGEECVLTVEVKLMTATTPSHDFRVSVSPWDGTNEGTPNEANFAGSNFNNSAYKQVVFKTTLPNMASMTKYRTRLRNLSTGNTASDGYRVRRAMLSRSVDIPRWTPNAGRDRASQQVTGGGGGGGGGGTGGGSGCEGGCVL